MLNNQPKSEAPENLAEIISTWDGALLKFQEHVYPVFEKYGFTLPEAYSLYRANLLYNELTPDDDEEEEWKKQK